MDSVNHYPHAYKQAPWRTQRQWVSVFLLIVLAFAMIAGLYLMVSSQAAIRGREIQDLREEILSIQYENADLQTELGKLTSKKEMERRAQELGFQPVKPDELEYLPVPGFVMPKAAILADAPEIKPSAPSIPPEYSKSLLDWLDEFLQGSGGLR